MPKFRWNWNYRSGLGVGVQGESADLPAELAEAINRDSPGVLSLVEEPKAETRAVDAPPSDRMQRRGNARQRGGAR